MLQSKISGSVLLFFAICSAVADPTVHSNVRVAEHKHNGRTVHSNIRVAEYPHDQHKHNGRWYHTNIRVPENETEGTEYKQAVQGDQTQGGHSQGDRTQGGHAQGGHAQGGHTQGDQTQDSQTQGSQTQDGQTQDGQTQDGQTQGQHKQGQHHHGEHKHGEHMHGEHRHGDHKTGEHKHGGQPTGTPQSTETQGTDHDLSARDVAPNVRLVLGAPEVATHDLPKRSDGSETEEDLDAPEHFGSVHARQSTSDATTALSLHNKARAAKYVPSLTWDTTLEASALAYAQALVKSGKFAHSDPTTRPNQGENLAYAWSSTGSVSNPITGGTNGWLGEINNYKGEAIPMGNFTGYGHYTQIMWNTTTKVGIATATDGKGTYYTVGRYSPPGNYGGQKPY